MDESRPPRAASSCPADDTVARFAGGSLNADAEAAVRHHIDTCSACRELLADVGADEAGAAVATPRDLDETTPGAILGGKYEVLRVLGTGGMGMVLAARHLELGQTVAIKVMHAAVATEGDLVKRFMREGRAAALLRSDHAVRIHDVGRLKSGLPFLVMEHLVGEDLERVQRRRTLEVSEVVDYILQAITSIAEAHESGLVHRDIKPQNLFLSQLPDGTTRVKVLDFGLAKDLAISSSSSGALTTEHMILGSPHYMSPEQIRRPSEVDARADVWALGASMVRLLTGHPPYEANSIHGLLARILTDPAPKVREKRPDVPRAIEEIIERCMEKNLERRYGSVNELAAALQLAVERAPSGTRRTRSEPVPDTVEAIETGARAGPRNPRVAPLTVTEVSPQPATLPMTATLTAPTAAPATLLEAAPATLQAAGPWTASAPLTPGDTVQLPTLPFAEVRSTPTARPRATPLESIGAVARMPPKASPRSRVARGWRATFFLITFAAAAVGVLLVREGQRRRERHVDPSGVTAAPMTIPSTASIAPPASPTLVAMSASPAPPAVPVAATPAPSVLASARPKRPKPAPPAVTSPSTATTKAAGATTPATCASTDPYCWHD